MKLDIRKKINCPINSKEVEIYGKSVLVIGGSGFLGRRLVHSLLQDRGGAQCCKHECKSSQRELFEID
jgi:5,10-methylene-tetrahydrofolate dehydrogenase/methenyl tetrahydrofolate cyclohydrolase